MNRGFSLVELSIVLVILGLLTGGILAGQSLIRASELRSVSTSFSKFQAAYYSFRDKYFAIPGDMATATKFWTSSGGDGYNAACQASAVTTTTCNGNGDGQIEYNSVAYGERFRAWQHLALAGLIEGSYTGRDGSAAQGNPADANFEIPGTNVPQARLSNSYFGISYMPPATGNAEWFDSAGGFNQAALGAKGGYPLKPEEQWNIDLKMDDGRPAYGIIVTTTSTGSWAPNCATTGVSATADYKLSYTSLACVLYYAIK